MTAKALPYVAVLTGDIVDSTKRPDKAHPRDLSRTLREAAKAAAAAIPAAGLSTLDIFRGDSWQLLVKEPSHALRAALYVRTYIRGGEARGRISWDTRIAIGIGPVEWLDPNKISRSQGAAFVASGEALDGLVKSKRRMAMRVAGGGGSPGLEAVVALLDALAGQWTAKQAWAIHGALAARTQAEIARSFVPPVTQQTVAAHLDKANWDVLEIAFEAWDSGIA